jgi:hypothetical protein
MTALPTWLCGAQLLQTDIQVLQDNDFKVGIPSMVCRGCCMFQDLHMYVPEGRPLLVKQSQAMVD